MKQTYPKQWHTYIKLFPSMTFFNVYGIILYMWLADLLILYNMIYVTDMIQILIRR